MKIGIVSDHRGYELKKQIMKKVKKIEFIDYGPFDNKSVDYPDYAFKLGEKINNKEVDLGVAICGSGIGMSIALNKVKNIRCSKINSINDMKISKKDNDPNAIAISANLNIKKVERIIEEFTSVVNLEERHLRRIKKINEYEQEH